MSSTESTQSKKRYDSSTRLLSYAQLCEVLSVSRNFIYEEIARGGLPQPVKLSPGRRGAARFIEAEILEYIDKKAAMREEHQHAL
jgi:predicted DNA-binding transcriptional regulator AlpA